MSTRRLALAVLWVALAVFAVGSSSAQAGYTHHFISQLTGFGNVSAIAFDAQGDIYLLDSHTKTVDRLSPSGVPLPFSASSEPYVAGSELTGTPEGAYVTINGLAVNEETGEVYVSDAGRGLVDVYSSSGQYLSQLTGAPQNAPAPGPFTSPEALEVDQATHDLYVSDLERGVVDIFTAGGEYVSQLGAKTESIGVNELTGEVYVENGSDHTIELRDALGSPLEPAWTGAGTPAGSFGREKPSLAVDQATQHVDVTNGLGSIYEFSEGSSEEYLGETASQSLEGFAQQQAVAVDPVTGDLYVAVQEDNAQDNGVVDVFGPDLVVPDTTTGAALVSKVGRVTLTGTVNPDNVESTTCRFEWGSGALDQVAPCPSRATGGTPVEEQVELTGLQPDVTYYYRLQAENENGSTIGHTEHFHSLGPGLGSESLTDIAASSATLNAAIDPNGAPTFYYFQYGPTSSYGEEVPQLSGSAPYGLTLGSGHGEVEFSQHVQNLSPGTTYHYRVVAVSEPAPGEYETFNGADQTFTTQLAGGSLTLPDGRSWEMVSPPQKHGAAIEPIAEQGVIQASADGDAITYATAAPTESDPQGYSNEVQVFSSRGASGWSSLDLTPPHESATGHSVGKGLEFRAFSLDLSQGLLEPEGSFMSLSPEATEGTAYLRDTGTCSGPATCYTPLVTAADDLAGTEFGGDVKFVGSTPDFSHIVLSSTVPLTAAASGSTIGLYEWAAGHLELVSVLPVAEGGLPAGPTAGAGLSLGHEKNQRNAVSNDGSRVIWAPFTEYGPLYMWSADGAGGNGETVRLDMVQSGGGRSGDGEAVYLTASSDGSRVFFTDGERLTENSHASVSSPDLYVCEMVVVAGKLTCDLTDLTPVGLHGESAHVEKGGPGAGADGSYVYFVAESALAAGAGGGPNMYVAHEDGGKWTTSFVATLTAEDSPDWSDGRLTSLTDRVSPDGHYLAFMSSGPLTGYDTRDAVTGQPDEEVYLYDAVSNRLVCASCNPTGARPVGIEYTIFAPRLAGGDRVWNYGDRLAANIPGWTPYQDGEALYQSRYLSDSGRLFFNSDDALVPQDVNGNEDVYEYEPVGVPAQSQYECTTGNATYSPRSGGCVGLISSGGSPEESAFLDASESGDNVFFLTSAKLLTQDFDTSIDIYDARECSAQSPCIPLVPVSPPPCTTGDACKAAPSPQPAVYGAPSSETFSGAGNVTPASTAISTAKTKGLSKAQRLARALKACSKKKGRRARVLCEKQARRAYGASHKVKTSRRGK